MAGHAARVDAAIAAASGEGGSTFAVDVSKWVRKAKGNTSAVIRKIAFDLGARIIMRTPVDSGRARANWMFAVGKPNTGTTDKLDTKTPVNDAGIGDSVSKNLLLQGLAGFDPMKQKSIFITNSLPYIKRLEFGWSKQAPAGMVRLTVAEFAGIARKAVDFVSTKGNGDIS